MNVISSPHTLVIESGYSFAYGSYIEASFDGEWDYAVFENSRA